MQASLRKSVITTGKLANFSFVKLVALKHATNLMQDYSFASCLTMLSALASIYKLKIVNKIPAKIAINFLKLKV